MGSPSPLVGRKRFDLFIYFPFSFSQHKIPDRRRKVQTVKCLTGINFSLSEPLISSGGCCCVADLWLAPSWAWERRSSDATTLPYSKCKLLRFEGFCETVTPPNATNSMSLSLSLSLSHGWSLKECSYCDIALFDHRQTATVQQKMLQNVGGIFI